MSNPKHIKNAATRLAVVQLIYAQIQTEDDFSNLLEDLQLSDEVNPMLQDNDEGEISVETPDFAILKQTLNTYDEHKDILIEMVLKGLTGRTKSPELLMQAIFYASATELFTAKDRGIDAPIIINDYLNVAHAFFNESEVKFINGVIDKINKTINT